MMLNLRQSVSCQGVTYLTHWYLFVGYPSPVCVACQEHMSVDHILVHLTAQGTWKPDIHVLLLRPPPPQHAAVFVADRRRRPISGDNRSMYMYVRHRRPPDRCRSSPTESQLFRQIIMCVMQCQYDVDVHLLFYYHDWFPTSMFYLDYVWIMIFCNRASTDWTFSDIKNYLTGTMCLLLTV